MSEHCQHHHKQAIVSELKDPVCGMTVTADSLIILNINISIIIFVILNA